MKLFQLLYKLKTNFYFYHTMAYKEKEFHKEENCLNCGYPLIGKYCGNCGQKAFLHKDSFRHMVMHFAADYFHYDNKFWTTIKTLFTKPGLVTLEYIQGKRAKFLNPIQLYIFVTTIYFLFFFANSGAEQTINFTSKDSLSTMQMDSIKSALLDNSLTGINTANADHPKIGIGELTPKEPTLKMYDSVQHSLPPAKRNNYFENLFIRKVFTFNSMNLLEWNTHFKEKFIHNFPKIFFILLPFFALLLKMVFRKSKLYYVDHVIFSVHFHAFLFIMLGIKGILTTIYDDQHFSFLIGFIIFIGLGFYLLRSFKRVYPSPWWKLILKQLFLSFMYGLGFSVVAILLLVCTFLFM